MRITLRNFILHRLIGVPRVLNTSASGASGTSQTIAADLKRAIQKLDTSGAQVDYAHVRASPGYADYRTQVAALRVFDLASLPTRADRIAFWLNLYNALVIDAVIAFGVQRSVTERQGGIGFFLRAAYNIGGQVYSLHDIEHGVLRENRGYPAFAGRQFAASDPRRPHVIDPMDVRIHFALNCASRSRRSMCMTPRSWTNSLIWRRAILSIRKCSLIPIPGRCRYRGFSSGIRAILAANPA
jgi:hypothetical protein